MKKPMLGALLALMTVAMLAAFTATAYALPTYNITCVTCHSGPNVPITATRGATTGTSVSYTLSALGAYYIAIFDGATKVNQITGASGTAVLTVGKTYRLFAVQGPIDTTGLGQLTITVAAPPAPTDTTAPTTLSNAVATYVSNATITLSASDNAGGSGVAATYYRLDGGVQTAGTSISTSVVGSHSIEFWSVDVAGNIETPHKTASFTVTAPVPDTTAPTTVSDAKPTYVGTAFLKLTAVDTGGSGVAFTYYILDGGVQTAGTTVLTSSVGTHTVEFWSVDVAGNIETPHNTVTFTVTAAPVPTEKVATALTIRSGASRLGVGRPFVLSGEITPALDGDRVIVYVKRPGSARWSISSVRAVYFTEHPFDDGSSGGGAVIAPVSGKWWYRYTPRLRGVYLFQVRFAGDANRAAVISRTVRVFVR